MLIHDFDACPPMINEDLVSASALWPGILAGGIQHTVWQQAAWANEVCTRLAEAFVLACLVVALNVGKAIRLRA